MTKKAIYRQKYVVTLARGFWWNRNKQNRKCRTMRSSEKRIHSVTIRDGWTKREIMQRQWDKKKPIRNWILHRQTYRCCCPYRRDQTFHWCRISLRRGRSQSNGLTVSCFCSASGDRETKMTAWSSSFWAQTWRRKADNMSENWLENWAESLVKSSEMWAQEKCPNDVVSYWPIR